MNVRASALCKVFEGGCSVRLPLLSALQQVLSAARHSSKSSPPALRARVLGTGEAEREGGAESSRQGVESTGRMLCRRADTSVKRRLAAVTNLLGSPTKAQSASTGVTTA